MAPDISTETSGAFLKDFMGHYDSSYEFDRNNPRGNDLNTKTRRMTHTLNTRQDFQVCTLINAEYASSRKNDADFARYATEKLGFTVTTSAVHHRREGFEIPNNKFAVVPSDNARITVLEARVESLSSELNKLLFKLGYDQRVA